MSLCLNNPVLGKHTTSHFTLDETNRQVVPNKGTDSVAGVLELNLGTATGDATNSKKALTAAGFTALATQSSACGNAMQQAIVKALAKALACNPNAQKAIGCAIASNPTAVACIASAL